MTCNSTAIAGWESFEWIEINGQVALKGFNGKFVSAEGGSANGMNSNRETASGWETYDWGIPNAARAAQTTNNLMTTTTNQDTNSLFSVYPNPVTNTINFNLKDASGVFSITIYNAIGLRVLEQTTSANTIDVSKLNGGSYILSVTSETGLQCSKLFVKK